VPSKQSQGDLNVFKRELELPTGTYTDVGCVKADVMGDIAIDDPPNRKGRPLEYDWDLGIQHMRKLLEERGDPRDPKEATESWRSDADVGRAVVDFLARGDGKMPDFKNAMKHLRPKLQKWRKEQKTHN
jgi:hypothetical protein